MHPLFHRDGPSPHITWAELACKDGTPYPSEWVEARLLPLAAEFEAVREILQLPIVIASAYRTEQWNRKVGGSRHSQHVQGRALDLRPTMHADKLTGKLVNDYDHFLIYDAVMKRVREVESKIRGLALYPWGVHIDIRPQSYISRWGGKRVQPEVIE